MPYLVMRLEVIILSTCRAHLYLYFPCHDSYHIIPHPKYSIVSPAWFPCTRYSARKNCGVLNETEIKRKFAMTR